MSYRREMGASRNALTDELREIWDAIRKMRQSLNRSVLPEDFTWGETVDGDLVIIQGGDVVSLGGGGGDCDCEDGATGPAGPAGATGPQGPEGPSTFIKVAKWGVD